MNIKKIRALVIGREGVAPKMEVKMNGEIENAVISFIYLSSNLSEG